MTASPPTPASLIVTRVVAKGREAAFRAWCDRVADQADRAPGHLDELRLDQSGGLFHVVHRFRSLPALRAWEAGDAYAALMAEGDRFSTPRRQEVTGSRPCVALPSSDDSAKWKRFVLVWLAVQPLVQLFNLGLDAAPVRLPAPLRIALTSATMIAAMTWLVLPVVMRRLKPWVLRKGDGSARNADDD